MFFRVKQLPLARLHSDNLYPRSATAQELFETSSILLPQISNKYHLKTATASLKSATVAAKAFLSSKGEYASGRINVWSQLSQTASRYLGYHSARVNVRPELVPRVPQRVS